MWKKIFSNFNIHTSIKPAWLTNITITQLVTCIGYIYNEKLCMNMSVTYNKSWKYVKIFVSQTFTCFRIQKIKGLQLECEWELCLSSSLQRNIPGMYTIHLVTYYMYNVTIWRFIKKTKYIYKLCPKLSMQYILLIYLIL